MKKEILLSGYYNPIHNGHLKYFKNVKILLVELFLNVNKDLLKEFIGFKDFQICNVHHGEQSNNLILELAFTNN